MLHSSRSVQKLTTRLKHPKLAYLPPLEGYLHKWDQKLLSFTDWRRLWFCLEGDKLFYYPNNLDLEHLGHIELRSIKEISHKPNARRGRGGGDDEKWIIEIITPSKPVYLKAKSKRETLKWITGLKKWHSFFKQEWEEVLAKDLESKNGSDKSKSGSDDSLDKDKFSQAIENGKPLSVEDFEEEPKEPGTKLHGVSNDPKETIAMLTRKVKDLEAHVASDISKLSNVNAQLEKLKMENSAMRKRHNDEVRQLKQQLEDKEVAFNAKILKLENDLMQKEYEASAFLMTSATKDEEIDKLTARIETLNAKVAKLNEASSANSDNFLMPFKERIQQLILQLEGAEKENKMLKARLKEKTGEDYKPPRRFSVSRENLEEMSAWAQNSVKATSVSNSATASNIIA